MCVCVCVCLFVVGGSQKSARRDTCKEMFCVKLIVSPSSLRACQGGEAIPPLFLPVKHVCTNKAGKLNGGGGQTVTS